jgi:GNAT superfamily N-acetyltransferase
MGFRFRQLQQSDYPFIFNSWLNSASKQYFKQGVVSQLYYKPYHLLIEKLLQNSYVLIAESDEQEPVLLGYLVFSEDAGVKVVHYIYTKFDFRGLGIASKLLEEADILPDDEIIHTAFSKSGQRLADHYGSLHHPFYITNRLLELLHV